jgi:hypothetical protein
MLRHRPQHLPREHSILVPAVLMVAVAADGGAVSFDDALAIGAAGTGAIVAPRWPLAVGRAIINGHMLTRCGSERIAMQTIDLSVWDAHVILRTEVGTPEIEEDRPLGGRHASADRHVRVPVYTITTHQQATRAAALSRDSTAALLTIILVMEVVQP